MHGIHIIAFNHAAYDLGHNKNWLLPRREVSQFTMLNPYIPSSLKYVLLTFSQVAKSNEYNNILKD